MVLITMIARLHDGLLLSASIPEDEQASRSLVEYQNQAKQLFKKMNENSPQKGSLRTGEHLFHYLIERNVVYLCLATMAFSKKLAFSYLEEIQSKFAAEYGHKVASVSRPYHFIEFDNVMKSSRKVYMDSRSRPQLNQVQYDLKEVQQIMVQNIDDVLHRGEALSALDQKAMNLAELSHKYKTKANKLNLNSTYTKIAAVVVVFFILILVIRFWLF